MMTDDAQSGILLVTDSDTTWLLTGEPYLGAMLSDEEYYPKPVRIKIYDSSFELSLGMPEGLYVGNLWAIHPGIIDRLRRQNYLIEEKL